MAKVLAVPNDYYHQLELGSNYLTSPDDGVRTYLTLKDPDWESTQSGGLFSTCATARGISSTECDVLVKFYTSTNGSGWNNHNKWKQSDNPCSWYGVQCTNGYVTRLMEANNQLTGTIPSELGSLANLEYLNLESNQLSGTIPTWLGSLTKLRGLNLEDNQFTGRSHLDWII